jgi:predicted anti-sigma-YlaC factor YlaD
MLNCKQVSDLISRSLDEKLTLRQRFGVGLHLIRCAICRRYEQQLKFLRTAARKLASGNGFSSPNLSRQAKQRIRETLQKHLDEKGKE